MADEYTPDFDDLLTAYAIQDRGSFDLAARKVRRDAGFALLAAHDAEIRRDQAEKDAGIAADIAIRLNNDALQASDAQWLRASGMAAGASEVARALGPQFTPSPETVDRDA